MNLSKLYPSLKKYNNKKYYNDKSNSSITIWFATGDPDDYVADTVVMYANMLINNKKGYNYFVEDQVFFDNVKATINEIAFTKINDMNILIVNYVCRGETCPEYSHDFAFYEIKYKGYNKIFDLTLFQNLGAEGGERPVCYRDVVLRDNKIYVDEISFEDTYYHYNFYNSPYNPNPATNRDEIVDESDVFYLKTYSYNYILKNGKFVLEGEKVNTLKKGIINSEGVEIKSNHSMDSDSIGYLNKGEQVKIVKIYSPKIYDFVDFYQLIDFYKEPKINNKSTSGFWVYVKSKNGNESWIKSIYINHENKFISKLFKGSKLVPNFSYEN